MNKLLKRIILTMASIVVFSLVLTLCINLIKSQPNDLVSYINNLFIIDILLLIIGSALLISEKGLFNVFIYSTKRVQATVSEKYKYQLQQANSLKDEDIKEYLKETYLYSEKKYNITNPLFISSSIIFLVYLIYSFIYIL